MSASRTSSVRRRRPTTTDWMPSSLRTRKPLSLRCRRWGRSSPTTRGGARASPRHADAAVAALQPVVDEQPTNQMAADYLAQAQDLPDTEVAADSDDSGIPV